VAAIAPTLFQAMIDGAKAETALKLYAVARKQMRGQRIQAVTKATSASAIVDQLQDDYGVDLSGFATELPAWFLEAAAERLQDTFAKPYWQAVNDHTAANLQSLIFQGIEQGKSIRELAQWIGEAAPERAGYRALNCARTETGNALNFGHVAGIKQLEEETGLPTTKIWLSIHGSTTRDSHAAADQQEVLTEDVFNVGGEQARWPGDENLSAAERCNCQCSVLSGFVIEELAPEDAEDDESQDIGGQLIQSQLVQDELPEPAPTTPALEVPTTPTEQPTAAEQVVEAAVEAALEAEREEQSQGIPSLADLTPVPGSRLGGSTGAQLMEDSRGNRYVVKRGSSPQHLQEEFNAEQLYRALGVPIPDSRMDDDGQPAKISRFIKGTPLNELEGSAKKDAIKQLRKHFAADVLLANWDVAGLDLDNVIIGQDGKAYRIDVGGALRFRAQGAPKGAAFGKHATELWTLRDPNKNEAGAQVFADMPFKDIVSSIKAVTKKASMATIKKATDDTALHTTLKARVESLKQVVTTAEQLSKTDTFQWEYADTFAKHEMQQDAAGLYRDLPKKLTKGDGYRAYNLKDEKGKDFDDLRGREGMGKKLADYVQGQGLPFGVINTYADNQSGDSWSADSIALKEWVARQRRPDTAKYYFQDGYENARQVAEEINEGYTTMYSTTHEKIDEARAAAHAFWTNFNRRVDFPGNHRKEGVVDLVRTESSSVISRYGMVMDGPPKEMTRGAAESYSITNVVEVSGTQLTVQRVPHHRIFANYLVDRNGNNSCFLYGDNENEFIADTAGLPVAWISRQRGQDSQERVRPEIFDEVFGKLPKPGKQKPPKQDDEPNKPTAPKVEYEEYEIEGH
jgi:hypothetical protein